MRMQSCSPIGPQPALLGRRVTTMAIELAGADLPGGCAFKCGLRSSRFGGAHGRFDREAEVQVVGDANDIVVFEQVVDTPHSRQVLEY